jgi:NhaP-type Na+/H+ or K+/H+ antiporter
MIIAVVFYDLADEPVVKAVVPIAALLGIMAIGFVILEQNDVLAHRLASKFGKIWVLAEILLFVYIGTEVQIDKLNGELIGLGLLILVIGLVTRSLAVGLALTGSNLTKKERLFCAVAYLPKASVQAAMGAVPLTMVLEGKTTSMTVGSGETILAVAVLSIVVTAPLGAIGIKLAGPRLLEQDLQSK